MIMVRRICHIACGMVVLVACGDVARAQAGFVEEFNGRGLYNSRSGHMSGLHNASWRIGSHGVGHVNLTDNGLDVVNHPGREEGSNVGVYRDVLGVNGFVQTVRIANVHLGDLSILFDPTVSFGHVSLSVVGEPGDYVSFLVVEPELEQGADDFWEVGFVSDDGIHLEGARVMQSNEFEIGMELDGESSEVIVWYDGNLSDDTVDALWGPYSMQMRTDIGRLSTQLDFSAYWTGKADGRLKQWILTGLDTSSGDIDGSGVLDIHDIDMLMTVANGQLQDAGFDLNSDQVVDVGDMEVWVHDLNRTYFGDANLDGEFNSVDLVNLFQAGEYEDGIEGNSTWATGDWNADGEFSSADLVLAFQDGGYEQGPRESLASVPEPSGMLAAWIGAFTAAAAAHRRRYEW